MSKEENNPDKKTQKKKDVVKHLSTLPIGLQGQIKGIGKQLKQQGVVSIDAPEVQKVRYVETEEKIKKGREVD